MSSIRKRASKFFRIKSSSGTASDPVPRVTASLDRQQPNRSISLPVKNATSSPSLVIPGEHSSQPSEGSTLGSGTVASKSLMESPPPVFPVPSPAPIEHRDDVLDGLGSIMDKGDVLARDAEIKAARSSQRDEEIRIFQAFDAKLELKSTATSILSQVKTGLLDEPWFMKALDEVAKLHTFAAGAVLIFKAVYCLEMARRQNDKRVVALYKEMRDMIEVVTRLKDIKDPDVIGPNGSTIKGKMESLLNGAAQEIKDCANACDAWMKKKTVLKVFIGPAWEGKLAAFASTFNMRRMQFEFALQIHTASAVDQIQLISQAMNEKLSHLTEQFVNTFTQLRPADEVQLAERVAAKYKGGIQAVRGDENALRELFKIESVRPEGDHRSALDGDGPKHALGPRPTQQSEYTFTDFKDELREDWKTALQNNLQAFEGKFQLYYERLEGNLHRYMREESDRVITEVNKGPHDLIRDPELKVIWKEMHWRRNVKARPFVMTLRDHFADKAENAPAIATSNESNAAQNTDSWARQYVDIKYLQPIMDAIDDDGSGHVTIAEINRFTEMLPIKLEWSLTVWLAYWAIGWQTFAARYCMEIAQLCARMFVLREKVHPMNRDQIEYYLRMTWYTMSELVASFGAPVVTIPDYAEEKFKEYVQYEEDRIRKNLIGIKYDIDALETVYGIVGPGRIEKHVLTLLCLMLRKDVELFEVATKERLHSEELWDAADSLIWVFDTIAIRYNDLVAQFRQQKLEVDKQITSISCELFGYYHVSESRHMMKDLRTTSEVEPNDDELPGAQLGDLPPYNYALQQDWPYSCEAYERDPDVPSAGDLEAPEMVKAFLGQWTGFIHDDDGFVSKTIFTFHAHLALPGAEHQIEAEGVTVNIPFTFRATVTQDNGELKIKAITHHARDYMDRYYAGTLRPDGSISGSQGFEEDETAHASTFLWMRTTPDLMALRPLPPYNVTSKTDGSLVPNKARAMFDYAIRAVIFQYRQMSWSWAYFKNRRDIRLRYVDFCIHYEANAQSDPFVGEPAKRSGVLQPINSIDRDFYESIGQVQWQTLPHHTNNCDTCGGSCNQGICLTCVDCIDNATPEADYGNTIDFCTLECSTTLVHPNPAAVKVPHDPSHSLFKRRKIVHARDLPLVYRRAKQAIAAFQGRFELVVPRQGGDETEPGDASTDQTAEAGAKAVSSGSEPPECKVCQKTLAMPCWFCVDCFHQDGTASHFICDKCEEKSLLECVGCKKPFQQPKWWYGLDPNDKFTCNTCIAKRVSVESIVENPHTYLHCLVRCYQQVQTEAERSTDDRIKGVETTMTSLDQRIATIEAQVVAIDGKLADRLAPVETPVQNVDSLAGRLSRLEDSMERIERLLSLLAAPAPHS